MAEPQLQTRPPAPKQPPISPELYDTLEEQAPGQLRGLPEGLADKLIKKKLAEIAKDTAERVVVEEADEAISAGTAAGVDETPVGPVVVGAEAAVGAWEAYKIAQNAKKTAKLLALLAAIHAATNVQVQEEKKDKKDCSKKPTS